MLTTHSQKRLERIERLKDDPYYIFDKKALEEPIAFTSSDIDSIPIVRLDDLVLVAPGAPLCIHPDVSKFLTSLDCRANTTRDNSPGRFPIITTSKTRVRG